MSRTITVRFQSADDAVRVDLSRIGQVGGLSGDDDLCVEVEPDIEGWDGVRDEVRNAILRHGLWAAGITVEIE